MTGRRGRPPKAPGTHKVDERQALTIRLEASDYLKLLALAKRERRTISNQIAWMLEQAVR